MKQTIGEIPNEIIRQSAWSAQGSLGSQRSKGATIAIDTASDRGVEFFFGKGSWLAELIVILGNAEGIRTPDPDEVRPGKENE